MRTLIIFLTIFITSGCSSVVNIFEDNKLKHNKFIPGVKIPIKNKSILKNKKNVLLVLAWNFYSDIKKNNPNLSDEFVNIRGNHGTKL